MPTLHAQNSALAIAPRRVDDLAVDGLTTLASTVLKFGGSSLASPARVRRVCQIILNAPRNRPIVVVSAIQGVTDALLEAARRAASGHGLESAFSALAERHRVMSQQLTGGVKTIEPLLRELRSALDRIAATGECPAEALDHVASFGERMSASIVAATLDRHHPARFVDARDLIVTDDHFTRAAILTEQTGRTASRFFQSYWRDHAPAIPVVTGFIGRTEDGRTTTIGRNGSDATAAVVGAALGASRIEIWTDVDGMFSADPRTVRTASVFPQLTYEQALRMSDAGAKVLHRGAIEPAAANAIPLVIKNTLNPAAPGTTISRALPKKRRSLAVGIIGVGNVGSALMRQLSERRAFMRDLGFDIHVVAIANSKRFESAVAGIDLDGWRDVLGVSDRPMDIAAFTSAISESHARDAAIVDCTAAAAVVDAYPAFVDANLHIVTPNKRANVLPWGRYTVLMDQLALRDRRFLYSTNVGAGLPVISTLQNLIAAGDSIVRIEGMLSGTLSYLFNTYDGRRPFAEIVRDAQAKGLTEPDPREDLSGQDVARKLLILARHAGLAMELEDIRVESLADVGDAEMADRFARAAARECVLRYVGTLSGGAASAALQEIPRDHPLASTKACDNVVAFTTTRYAATPLVIQGPGAGAEVTAAGVFSDLLNLMRSLPEC